MLTAISILVITTVLSQKTSGIIRARIKLEATDKTKLVKSCLEKRQLHLSSIGRVIGTLFDSSPYSVRQLITTDKLRRQFCKKNNISGMKFLTESKLQIAGKMDKSIQRIARAVYLKDIPYVGVFYHKVFGYRFVAFLPLRKRGLLIYLYENFSDNLLYRMQNLVGSQIVFFNVAGKCWKTTIFERDGVEYHRGFSVPKKRLKKLINQSGSYSGFKITVLGFKYVISLHGIYDYWNQLVGSFGSMVLEYDAYESLNDNYFISIRVALIIFIFIGLVAFYFISKIVRSYKEISIMSLEIAHGNLNKRISKIPNDELGELILSVNMMADSVKSSIKLKKTLSKELRKHQLASGLSVDLLTPGQHYLREKPVFVEDEQLQSLGRPLLVLSDSSTNSNRIAKYFEGNVNKAFSRKVLLEMVNKEDYKAIIVDSDSTYTPLKMLKLKRKHPELVKIPLFYL